MKDFLDRIKEIWDVIQIGPENEILRNYAEKSKIFIKHVGKLFFIANSLIIRL